MKARSIVLWILAVFLVVMLFVLFRQEMAHGNQHHAGRMQPQVHNTRFV